MPNSKTISLFLIFILQASILIEPVKAQNKDLKLDDPSVSKWIKIDDFESTNPLQQWILADTRNDTKPKIENPQVTEVRSENEIPNHYLIKKPAAEGIVGNRKALSYKKLPITVNIGETYTFYTRFKVEYFPNNHIFGLSNLNPEGINLNDYNALEPSLRITDKYESDGTKNTGTLMVRKDGEYAYIFNKKTNKTANPLQSGKWYEVWYVVNNAKVNNGGQSYDVFIRGGDEFPKQQCVFTDATFRMKRELPLTYFLTNCNTGPVYKPYGNGGLCYDDIYMAPGKVLTVPID
ncbi:hypothetical protein N1F78_10135 [Seonamhaeicola sp. MEBiC1930]|uniref:hypothetical protein n=1 Tax=Seonamhaeicola sp. MEBiC01930 TaxID=2976768 RepID=UPI003247BFCF